MRGDGLREPPPVPSSSRGIPPPHDGMSAARVAFPQSQEQFDSDPRVSYSKLDEKWILEDDDGSEWEYHPGLARWMPSLDEEEHAKQQQAYAVEGVDEQETVEMKRKRKKEEGEDGRAKGKKVRKDEAKTERKNSAVYITSLPPDATVSEIHSVFSKYGVISEEIDSSAPRIKLYTDDAGNFKGDALVIYFRPESIPLAIQMLDDSDFRLGQEGPQGKMRVKEADRSYKKQQDVPTREPTKRSARDRQKVIRKTQMLNDKLADWSSDEEPSALTETSNRNDKVVILTHMFTLAELEADPAALLEIKEDVRDECGKLGPVTNVVLFDAEPEGIVSVRFANAIAARDCVRVMDGRHFGGQRVDARLAESGDKFKKKRPAPGADEEDGDEADRLDEFGAWLENEGAEP